MRKEEHTIALLEGHAMGSMGLDELRLALKDSPSYASPEEAIDLFASALQAIEFSGLRTDISHICKEEQGN